MNIPRSPHNWKVTPGQAVEIQKKLSLQVCQKRPLPEIRIVAGIDAAYSADGKRCIAGVILWDRQEREVIEKHIAVRPLEFPYIPGLLSFREMPAALAALRKLQHCPDAIICDGQGIAHPRRFGIACHVGVIAKIPTIGCGKSRLIGSYTAPANKRGSASPLSVQKEVVGTVLCTKDRVKPLFVSVGHLIDLPTAEQLVLACATGYRLPEPTRLADHLVSDFKKRGRFGRL